MTTLTTNDQSIGLPFDSTNFSMCTAPTVAFTPPPASCMSEWDQDNENDENPIEEETKIEVDPDLEDGEEEENDREEFEELNTQEETDEDDEEFEQYLFGEDED